MTTYLVETYATKLDEPRIRELAAGVRAAAAAMTRDGVPIRYVSSIFVPEDDMCFHLVEAPSAEAVRQASERVAFTFERIVSAVETRERKEQ